jgi:hypothetical protein
LFIDLYVVNGPGTEGAAEEGHDEEPEGDEHDEESLLPEIAFEAEGADNNGNKAFGGRVAVAWLPGVEGGVSYYNGAYDDEGELTFEAGAIDLNIIGRHYTLRGEYVKTIRQAFEEDHDNEGVFERVSQIRDGWYLQGSWSARQLNKPVLNPAELVLRYAHVGGHEAADRWTIGINYWLDPRAVAKFAIEQTDLEEAGNETRFLVQFAYGF